MSASVGTLTSGAMSALIFELEDDADDFLGVDPISASAPTAPTPVPAGRFARWLQRMRTNVIPRLINEANETDIELVLSLRVADGRNALSYTTSEASQTIRGIVLGPSAENLERGFLAPSDHQVILAANDITVGLSAKHKIKFNDEYFDMKMIKPVPRYPAPVAYVLGITRLS